jgi:phosphate transport system ATP-binding protein
MADNHIIEIKDLNVSIDGQRILKNISLEIPRNKITVVIGPSGCGKTTLLKCINRLIDLTDHVKVTGKILLNNEDILEGKDLPAIRRKAGLLSQRPYPLPMSICKNVAFGLKMGGRNNRHLISARVEYYLKQVSLWDEVKDRLNAPASSLSIGQQQRLCLARGLAVDPPLILADEPTSALDPLSSQAIEQKFFDLKDRYSIILVTHILRQARRIADYVVFMYMGEVIEHNNAAEFFENPQHNRTKEYIQGLFY